ncbi:MAG TPA: Clp protease N-terminal domain-containing protein [Dongiaceae bacterium]|nr:Clp protease N-terminal domain-containing protein [Dongiaceae bacterium]
MFQRFTERARRAVFFSRYEASRYGSRYIDTEHLLLGLLREDHALLGRFLGPMSALANIRTEIEEQITPRERISTYADIPLTNECKKVLALAVEEADRLAHQHVGTDHVLIGLLRAEGTLASRILAARGLKAVEVREQLSKTKDIASRKTLGELSEEARVTLESFLAGLSRSSSEDLVSFFTKNAEVIDASGKRWNHEEISRGFETIFAPYAKRNATYTVEATLAETSELLVTNVLWKNALLASEPRVWMHRMSVILVSEAGDWKILLTQVTPVQPS